MVLPVAGLLGAPVAAAAPASVGGGLLGNPLLALGAGMMRASAPSFDPAAGDFGHALGTGLLTMQDALARQEAAQEQRARTGLLQQRQQMAANEMEAAREAQEGRRQGLLAMVAALPPEQQGAAIAAIQADSEGASKALLGRLLPEPAAPTSAMRNYELAVSQGYPGSFMDYQAAQRPPGTNITIQNRQPMKLTDLERLRKPDGSMFSPGTSLEEAIAQGGVLVTTDQAKAGQKAKTAMNVLDRLDDLALGKGEGEGLFVGREPGLLNFLGRATETGVQRFTQTDPRYATYEGFAAGTLAPIIKTLGESGALAERDVARAYGLVPNAMRDTETVARNKLKQLRDLLAPALLGKPGTSATPKSGKRVNWSDLP